MVRWLRQLVLMVAATAALALAFAIAVYLYGRPNPARVDAEQYQVLSDYISPGLTGDSHDLGSRSGLVVILGRTTVTDMLVSKNRLDGYRVLLATVSHARHKLPVISQWAILNLLVANLRPQELREDFTIPAKYVLATEADTALYGTPAFEQKFPRNYGYLTFTRVGFNRELTEAVFYTEHVCGLCGEGKYVYMRKLNGKWVVQAEAWAWVS